MECPRCGSANTATNAFCEACGTPLELTCGACGNANRADSHFCGKCGSPLPSSTTVSPSSADLLRALTASGGERKHLTVLFADIRDSTSLIAGVDPETAMRRIQPAIDAMKDAVHRYDGVVNKVQGDGVMALFGAPQPLEDHAVRACLAALAMRDSVTRLGDADLNIRIGLHTGEVVVQAVDSSLYQTYDAAGVAVHLANRMEQMADQGGILLTRETFAAAEQFVEARSLGVRSVRGISEPIEVFALIELKPAPASERFRSGPRSTPLSGRKRDLETLELELESVYRGDARVVGVVGEAGIGKSRLCFEFAESCRRRGIRVLEARVLAHGRATPFQPVLELLRDFFGIRPKEPAEVSRRRITEVLEARGHFTETLPLLFEFLGIPDGAHPAVKLDPKTRKLRLLHFVKQVVRSRPRDEIVLVLLEDLHWIDQASEEFTEAMVDALVGTSTLLLVNFRPGYSASWMQRSHYRQINLVPLDESDSKQILNDLLGNDPSLALLCRNIEKRALGNPFFLEELVRALVERGDFEGDRGAYRLRGGIDLIPLPATVQAVISARIDRLGEKGKQILQTAAVIGREVPLAILASVVGFSSNEISEVVSRLRQAELLYEMPPFEQGVHAFRHPLIQEVAYQSLLHVRRRKLHAAVAAAMEIQYKDTADERAGLLAYHLEKAGDNLKAAQANARAAMWVGANDSRHALQSWKRVRELLIGEPASPSTDFLRMMACGQIINFGWREGIAPEEAERYFDEASRLALAFNDMRANALIHAGYGRIVAAAGSADEYVKRIREAELLAQKSTGASVRVVLKAILCHALRLSGRMAEALQVNIEAMEHAHEIDRFDRQVLGFDIDVWLTLMRGQTLIVLGRGMEARPYLDRVIQMDSNKVDATHHIAPSVAYVDLAWIEHDVHLAEQHAERALSMALNSGSPYIRVYAQASRGLSHLVAGRLDASIEDLTDVLNFARRRMAGLEHEARILADLSNAYRLKGDIANALRAGTEAIEVAARRCSRVPECLARIVRADALWASTKDAIQVKAELMQAQALMEETGAIIFKPLIEEIKSKLLHGTNTMHSNLSTGEVSSGGRGKAGNNGL
jgi:class 3 adenylate cyclase/tetratricopeptide (TPR) repeat protein